MIGGLAVLALVAPLAGQQVAPVRWPKPPAPQGLMQAAPQEAIAFAASAILPGAGQYYLKEDRWVPYLAVEAWAWLSYANQKQRGRSLERQYRELAWQVARRICGCVRRDSVFAYYEAMAAEDINESGFFDMDEITAGLQPDTSLSHFNGREWQRAKELYLAGQNAPPGSAPHDSALAYYRRNAIPSDYQWDWNESPLEKEAFSRLIDKSDDALRRATRALGLILANHVVSAIDALVTARLKAVGATPGDSGIESYLEPEDGAIRWKTTVRIPLWN